MSHASLTQPLQFIIDPEPVEYRGLDHLSSPEVIVEFDAGFSVDGLPWPDRLRAMSTITLPDRTEMFTAFTSRDASYDGVFITAVKTTGIFCRPTCTAKKPRPENVEFYADAQGALLAGFRPCKRCRPMTPGGQSPEWADHLLQAVEADPAHRWTDADLRTRDLDPDRVRRWFQRHHGMTFHAYHRARRLGLALGRLHQGERLTQTGFEHGFESDSGFREAFGRLFGEPPGRARHREVAFLARIRTPLGPMVAGATEAGICLLEFADRRMLETQLKRIRSRLGCATAPGDHVHLAHLKSELEEFFAGRLQRFSVPLVMAGTPFQMAVWRELSHIPYGSTTDYQTIATAIGKPGARRAVGRANGDNRLAILLPCHRVVGRDGTLTGYGGGLWRKRRLLELEGASEPAVGR